MLGELILRDDVPTDYTTRIIIRRPANDHEFTGNVAVEWWNSTAGFDTAPVWDPSAEWFAREGWIYVGVSNADEVIAFLKGGCPVAGGPPTCGTRYASLSLPEDGIAYEMVSQIVNLLRGDSPQNPLGALEIQHVFHAGQSQQAGSVNTYATEFHQDALNDGYFIQAGGGSARLLSTGSPNFAFGDPRGAAPTFLPVPVIRVQTETDVAVLGANFTRQVGQDNANFRYYELAGATHLTVHEDIEILPAGALFPGSPPIFLEDLCLNPLNTLADGPVFGKYVYNAMWKALEKRAEGGVQMPTGTPLVLDFSMFPPVPPTIVRDPDGNALGGIRTPDMNVPTASYNPPTNVSKPACDFVTTFPPACDPLPPPLGFLACFLGGSAFPFDQTRLGELYSSHEDYVNQVDADANRLRNDGFLLNRDLKEIVDRAKAAPIP